MLFYILVTIIIVSLAIITAIIVRRWRDLAVLQVDSIAQKKEEAVKEKILLARSQRALADQAEKLFKRMTPWWLGLQNKFRILYDHFLKMDKARRLNKLRREGGEPLRKKIEQMTGLARDLLGKEQFDAAEKTLIDILILNEKEIEAYKILGELYFKKKDYQPAREVYKHLIKLTREDPLAHLRLADIEKNDGHLEEARKSYEAALSLNDQQADCYEQLGEICLMAGDQANAQRNFKKALEIEPNNPKYLDLLLGLSIIGGSMEAAQEYYQKLKAVNPDNEKLAEYRNKISGLRLKARHQMRKVGL